MTKPKIGLILSTTRQGRFADRPTQWVLDIANARGDADYEIVDLRDYPIAYFDAPASPRFVPLRHEVAIRWARRIAELDGYTAEARAGELLLGVGIALEQHEGLIGYWACA